MREETKGYGFTVYLEGHQGHQGNVLAHAFLDKVRRLVFVLNKLERAYIESDKRQTDFEIIAADKRNPTTLSLKPVPRVRAYDPSSAFQWGMQQINLVARGEATDARVDSDIAADLVDLATKRNEYDYTSFWINGYAESVKFDDAFLRNAQRIAHEKARMEYPTKWHTGVSFGSIVGELKALDDVDCDKQFIIVPFSGAQKIVCKFPESIRTDMGKYVFKIVTVSGILHYSETSPFPQYVEARTIEPVVTKEKRKSLSELRGVFRGAKRTEVNWDELMNV